ncbi:P-loop containing nucleoside triphosphate hydrolase [Phytophthora cactorum]|nr:P-loop containing nucleoside triphosphate hydrolase [Phytophthora cactorum]
MNPWISEEWASKPLSEKLQRSLAQTAKLDGGAPAIELPTLELQCELDSLLDLYPSSYRDAIREVENYHFRLVDICIDVGRAPFAYTGKRQRILLSQDGTVVSKETSMRLSRIWEVRCTLETTTEPASTDNCTASPLCAVKPTKVYGLTMRVGRALRNAACVLTDLLLSDRHADKSVLVLGHPGSGKTTLIETWLGACLKRWRMCVSSTRRTRLAVMVGAARVCGVGSPHYGAVTGGTGWVMVECVQNHTVETLIVDEIGRKAGCWLRRRVDQESVPKGLVGGSQQVTVGDAAAKSSKQGEVADPAASNPIFDVIVELDHVVRGRCRIIWDVAKAVVSVLECNGYSFETRRWDASTQGVQFS